MADITNGWLGKNERRKFPLHITATGVTDAGDLMPFDILTDISVTGTIRRDETIFVSSVSVTKSQATVSLATSRDPLLAVEVRQFATAVYTKPTTKNLPAISNPPLATFFNMGVVPGYTAGAGLTAGEPPLQERIFYKTATNSGMASFGNVHTEWSGVFSTPAQSRLDRAAMVGVQYDTTNLSNTGLPLSTAAIAGRDIDYINVPGYSNSDNPGESRSASRLQGTVKLLSGLDITVSTANLLQRASSPDRLIASTYPNGVAKKVIVLAGNVKTNLTYLPRCMMADEDDCSTSGYPPAIRTIGGVSPKATPLGGEMSLEFDNLRGLTSLASLQTNTYTTIASSPLTTEEQASQISVTAVGSTFIAGSLCKKLIKQSVPGISQCDYGTDDTCSGVFTFGDIPLDWNAAADLPTSQTVPRLKPNGDPCPPIETLEDELPLDYAVEFGSCFDPVYPGEDLCRRWYSRRVWAFHRTTFLPDIKIVGGNALSYAPADWSVATSNVYTRHLSGVFLGMPARTYLNKTLMMTAAFTPAGTKRWSYSSVLNSNTEDYLELHLSCYAGLICEASIETPYAADIVLDENMPDVPTGWFLEGRADIRPGLEFGVGFGTVLRKDNSTLGAIQPQTGYWLLANLPSGLMPLELLIGTTTPTKATVLISIFAARTGGNGEVVGTVNCRSTSAGAVFNVTHNFSTPPHARWAGDPAGSPSQPLLRSYIGFSLGPNTVLNSLEI